MCFRFRTQLTLVILSSMISVLVFGQSAQAPAQPNVAPGVPRLVKFSGVLKDAAGNLLTNAVGITFAVYGEQTGGVPLWQETQNVQFSQGRYTAFIGQNSSAGIPAELFTSGQPRWLGVKALLPDETEQPRVLLASVPYALKAVDADTLGGLPASAFLQANGANVSNAIVAPGAAVGPGGTLAATPSSKTVTTSGGKVGTIPQFDSSTDVKNSPIVVNSTPTNLTDVVGMANLNVRNFENVLYADQFPGTGNHDIGDKINQAYASCPSSGCKIKVAAGVYRYTTPISIATPYKPAVLEGDPGETATYTGYPPFKGTTELYYTPTSGTAITMSTWGGTGSGIKGITLMGPGFAGKNSAIGLALSSGIRHSYSDLMISGFNVGIQIGSDLYLQYFYNLQMQDNVKAIYAPPGLTFTGENIAFFGGVLTNKSTSLPGGSGSVPFYPNCVDFEGGQGIVVSFYNISFDHCGVTLNIPGGQQFLFSGSHFENPNGPTTADFLTIGSNCVSCQVILSGSDMLEDPPGSARTEMISMDGGSRLVIVGGIYVAAEPIPQLIKSNHPANAVTVLGADKFNSIPAWVGGSIAGFVTLNPRQYQPLTVAGGPIIIGNDPTINGSITSAPLGAPQTWTFPNASGTVMISASNGDVSVAGNLAVAGALNVTGAKHFKIDHPLDPANKYLYHASVESPDMMNIYNGTTVLDTKGEAEIKLPDWFEALNRDFRYQLSCVGGFAPVYVAKEIENNTFRIAGGTSGLKVSWQVTGVRHDAYAEAHPSPVEVEKPAGERGHYLHPELFGASPDKEVGTH
jgi:hypothetical protein